MKFVLGLALFTAACTACLADDVRLAVDGALHCVIVSDAATLDAADKAVKNGTPEYVPEMQRRGLRASVADLSVYLARVAGAAEPVPVLTDAAAVPVGAVPILVGAPAAAAVGEVGHTAVYKQAYRYQITPTQVALFGESDLATSYAIYELLDRLGCRWFMPGVEGEVIPELAVIALPATDEKLAPYTWYRGIWYGSEDYKRRNRCGGLLLSAGHALEFSYVKKEDYEAHPEWVATVDGKPNPHRLKMSAPGLPEAISERIVEYVSKTGTPTVSLSPGDGLGYDNSPEDRALDAGDWDPSIQDVSMTDRLVWFCNKIIAGVEKVHPDVYYGMLAYANYTRAPVRETLNPHLVPQFAPITYTRAHPLTDINVPNNKELREAIDGWGKAAAATSFYYYAWFLAEPSAPNPFITKWSVNVPYAYEHGACRLWQPETTANFETTMHALYMGLRLAWDPTQNPQAIVNEINERFYGAAAPEMTAYWTYIDSLWVDTPEYSGCGFGHLRRFTAPRMAQARRLMDAARAAARSPMEHWRVNLAHESLALFEQFMALREDLAAGRWAGIDTRAQLYQDTLTRLCDTYTPNSAFGRMGWVRETETAKDRSINGAYFRAFYNKTYTDAARLARETDLITPALRTWAYQADTEKTGPARTWDDAKWKDTDVIVDTWSALGLHNYMGGMWYKRRVTLPAQPAGKKVFLWVGATDGSVRVEVNGTHVPYVNAKGETVDVAKGYAEPFSFDITSAIVPGDNEIVLYAVRTDINELGTGGLLAPVTLYRER